MRNQQELSHSEDLGKYEDQIYHPKQMLQVENNAVCTALDYQESKTEWMSVYFPHFLFILCPLLRSRVLETLEKLFLLYQMKCIRLEQAKAKWGPPTVNNYRKVIGLIVTKKNYVKQSMRKENTVSQMNSTPSPKKTIIILSTSAKMDLIIFSNNFFFGTTHLTLEHLGVNETRRILILR